MHTKFCRSFFLLAAVGWLVVPAQGHAADDSNQRIVHLELEGPILEVAEDPFGFGGSQQTTRGVLDTLQKIKTDPEVPAVFITLENVSMGLAQAQELRTAIQKLKAADKEVFVHLDSCYSTALYWLVSSASKIAVVPTGDVWVTGFYGEQLYVKDMLAHLHMEADVIHIGDYKSAGEIFYRNEPSEPAAEMTKWLLDDLYRQMIEQIGDDRGIAPQRVKDVVNAGPYSAEQAQSAGLIDDVKYRMDFVQSIKSRYNDLAFDKKYGKKTKPELDLSNNPFAVFEFLGDMLSGPEQDDTPSVGLIYVLGAIMPGEGESGPFGGVNHGASSRLRKALYEAAHDEDIKAVVLRVDSPGGSAVASEIIWNATQEVANRKPFIVSMGNVAGSGGYYVSCGADTIFAEPGTITGSIGVVGMKLVTKGMWDWMGVHWHPVKRGDNADIMATDKPWSDVHRSKIRNWMVDVYDVFKSRIKSKRKDKLAKPLEQLAGGRVYTGAQALELGLVDKLGGLQEALRFAALQAELGTDYKVRVMPKQKNLIDKIMEDLGFQARMSGVAALGNDPMLSALRRLEPQKAQAFERMIDQVQILQKEGILLAMPSEIVFK